MSDAKASHVQSIARFKEAETVAELEQIRALNHRIFAEEIGQHPVQPSGLLSDKFESQSRYFLAIRETRIVGMISANPGPSFSVSKRLSDIRLLGSFSRPLEIRLLAIEPESRYRTVLAGLLWQVYDLARTEGFSHLLISAIASREKMYRKIGFRALGAPVSEGAAAFLPMVMDVDSSDDARARQIELHGRRWARSCAASKPVSLMPGPVCIDSSVSRAFAAGPESHRSARFITRYERVKELLAQLLEGAEVAILPGGGTLANDAVAANLKAIFDTTEGLIISNGEFGERLVRHALASGLQFRQVRFEWGRAWRANILQEAIERKPAWIWAVQLETSTGVLNKTDNLIALARQNNSVICLDCVSSIGACRIARSGDQVFLATGVSGKSLGSFSGLAFVYAGEECRSRLFGKSLPPSFDILTACRSRGPVSTVSSPLIVALAAALENRYASDDAASRTFQEYTAIGRATRQLMRDAGLEPLADEIIAAPNISTFLLPHSSFPSECRCAGYEIAYESPYLRDRGWGQIATMGDVSLRTVTGLFERLRDLHMHV